MSESNIVNKVAEAVAPKIASMEAKGVAVAHMDIPYVVVASDGDGSKPTVDQANVRVYVIRGRLINEVQKFIDGLDYLVNESDDVRRN